jgi:hypothetical protein
MPISAAIIGFVEGFFSTQTKYASQLFYRKSSRGTQITPLSSISMSFINMVNHNKEEIYLSTKTHNYGNYELMFKWKETSDPQKYFHIDKPEKNTSPYIPKGVYNHASQNPNVRSAPNYSIF